MELLAGSVNGNDLALASELLQVRLRVLESRYRTQVAFPLVGQGSILFRAIIGPQSPGRIQKMAAIIHTIGVLESSIGGSIFWILTGLWVRYWGSIIHNSCLLGCAFPSPRA